MLILAEAKIVERFLNGCINLVILDFWDNKALRFFEVVELPEIHFVEMVHVFVLN